MIRLRILMSRFMGLFRRARREQELNDEVSSHLEMLTQENRRRGMSPDEARSAALRSFGGVDQIKEQYRDQRGLPWLESFFQDLRFGLRGLRRNPGFAAVAVLTLALGIGATTAIFTVVNAVLLRPLPYPHPEELVYVQQVLGNYGVQAYVYSPEYSAWQDRSRSLRQVAAYMFAQYNLTGGGEPERVKAGMATASFFSLLGVRPVAGRTFLPGDDAPGTAPVVVLSEALWRRRYGGNPSIVGKGITLDGKEYTVVGVLPSSFVVPDKFKLITDYALWVPLVTRQKGMAMIRAIGRLKPAVTVATAQAELDAIAQSALPKRFLELAKVSVVLSTWHDQVTENSRRSLLLILGAVGFLLLIACVNVANLVLSRATAREREIAVRLATGASRSRIVRQLLTESALLALAGGLLGLGLARWGKDLLVAFISPNLPALEPIGLDYRVLGFSLALAVVTGLAAGLAPALQSSKVSLSEVLKEASRSTSEVRSGKVFRNVLIVFETALALVLLVGSGLLFRSFLRVRGIDLGFRSKNFLSMTVNLTPSEYATPNVQAAFFQQLMERIKGLEGVQAVAGSTCPPLGSQKMFVTTALKVEGQVVEVAHVRTTAVSPGYFRALGIPLTQGRYFTEADGATSPSVVIVDESFARRYCLGGRCLGGRIGFRRVVFTIVGIVANARDEAEQAPTPEVYVPFAQASQPYMAVLVRTAGNPKLWASAVRSQVAIIDKDQPPHDVMTLDDLRTQSLTPRRVNMLLFGAFGALGLILASIGIYGMVSYSVSQRTHEIGVRMALGAERGDVLRFVIRQGLTVILIGVAVGIIGALALTRFLSTLLYGVKPTDPATIAAVSVLLIVVAALASVIPARRATTLDPMVALRYE